MSIRHHPGADTLFCHATGGLDSAAATVIATHAASCPACQAYLAPQEAVGGALLADLPPAEMAEDALARTLARLDERPAASPAHGARWLAKGLKAPATLDGFAVDRWRWLAPGVRRMTLLKPAAGQGQLYLLHIEPGTRVPRHGHDAWEATCVLAGAFVDEMGEFGPGDLAEVNDGQSHIPVAIGTTPCICLVAAAGRMRFQSRLARVFQALVGV